MIKCIYRIYQYPLVILLMDYRETLYFISDGRILLHGSKVVYEKQTKLKGTGGNVTWWWMGACMWDHCYATSKFTISSVLGTCDRTVISDSGFYVRVGPVVTQKPDHWIRGYDRGHYRAAVSFFRSYVVSTSFTCPITWMKLESRLLLHGKNCIEWCLIREQW